MPEKDTRRRRRAPVQDASQDRKVSQEQMARRKRRREAARKKREQQVRTRLTVLAVIIVLAMNLVGSLLISALIIFPAMSAMRLFRSFKGVTVCSAVLSVSCALLGILISILWSTPVGSTIVAVDIGAFLIFCVIAKLKGGIAK